MHLLVNFLGNHIDMHLAEFHQVCETEDFHLKKENNVDQFMQAMQKVFLAYCTILISRA